MVGSVVVIALCLFGIANAVRINAGGAALPGYEADASLYHGGTSSHVRSFANTGGLVLSAYSTHAWTPGKQLVYAVPVSMGAVYKVTLGFAENYAPAAKTGFRVFDVVVNDVVVAANVDVWTTAGALFTPILIEANGVVPVNSSVTVKIVPKMQNPMLSLLAVEEELTMITRTVTPSLSPTTSTALSVTTFPSMTPTPSATASPSMTPTPSVTASPSMTPTPSVTASPSMTPTASVTASPSMTPTPSVTASPSISASPSSSVSAKPSLSPLFSLKLNAGGPAIGDDDSVADTPSDYALTQAETGTFPLLRSPTSVYDNHRWAAEMSSLVYSVAVPSRTKFKVVLRFSENYLGAAAPGARLFNVTVNGVTVGTNVDVYTLAGGLNLPYDITVSPVYPVNGVITIVVIPIRQNAMLNGFDVIEFPRPKVPFVAWERTEPNYPLRVFEAQGGILGNQTHKYHVVIGGFYKFPGHTNATYQRALNVPDAPWQRMADMPQTLTHMAQWSSGEVMCGAGGFIGPNDPGLAVSNVWCFDRVYNKWVALPDLPEDRASGGLLLTVNSHGFREFVYAGGLDRTMNNFKVQIDYGTTWTLAVDVPGATWEGGLPDMMTPRNHIGSVESCGRYFFLGGQFSTNEETGNQVRVDEWLPDERRWSETPPAPLPFPVGHISASVMPYKCGMVVVGGITNGRQMVSTTLYWEPTWDEWYNIGVYPQEVATPVCGILGKTMHCATGGEEAQKNRVYVGTIVD